MEDPRPAWDEKQNRLFGQLHEDPDRKKKSFGQKRWVRILLLNAFLCILVALYCIGGAYLFKHIEGSKETAKMEQRANYTSFINDEKDRIAARMNGILHNESLSNDSRSDAFGKELKSFHDLLLTGFKKYHWNATINPNRTEPHLWAVESALLFCVTVITTIGYGHVTPVTILGQMICILYALLGVPLMLMFLANIGEVMASAFRIIYGRGCCYFCWKRRKENYEYNREMVRKARAGRGKSAWLDKRTRRRNKGTDDRSPSPEGKKKKKLTKEQEEVDWEYLRTIDPDSIVNPDDDIVNVPITLTLVVIAIYIFLGAVLFATWEGWTWIKGGYFSFVTLSTIGFGDLVPGWSEVGTSSGFFKLLASVAYIIIGLAVLSMSFNLMMEEMASKFRWLGHRLGILDEDEGDENRDEDNSRDNTPRRNRKNSEPGDDSRPSTAYDRRPGSTESTLSEDDDDISKYKTRYL